MTIEQAKAFIAKYENAINYVRPSHLEEMSPLYERHIEAVVVKRDDFHSLHGGVLYPRKETTDTFGRAAGISFADTTVSTRNDDGVFVGRAVPQELGPDGKMITWNAAEYEFDPETRAKIDIANSRKNGETRYDNEYERELAVLNYKKVGRRRADTGARAAAIISVIGMSTGFKASELFPGNTKTRVFLFSRVIVNSKNELVLNKALESMFSSNGALYGPQAVAQITGEAAVGTTTMERPAERNVTPGADELDPDDDFESEPAATEPEPVGSEKQKIWQAIVDYSAKYNLPSEATDEMKAMEPKLAELDTERVQSLLDRIKRWVAKHPESEVQE